MWKTFYRFDKVQSSVYNVRRNKWSLTHSETKEMGNMVSVEYLKLVGAN